MYVSQVFGDKPVKTFNSVICFILINCQFFLQWMSPIYRNDFVQTDLIRRDVHRQLKAQVICQPTHSSLSISITVIDKCAIDRSAYQSLVLMLNHESCIYYNCLLLRLFQIPLIYFKYHYYNIYLDCVIR